MINQTNGHVASNGSSNGNGNGFMRHVNRVVITGLGAITPVGLTVDDVWDSVTNGRSGIGYISRFDPSELRTHVAGEVHGFKASDYMDRKEARRADPFIQFALAATRGAVEDSGIDFAEEDPARVGVIVASATGGLQTTIENEKLAVAKGLTRVNPFFIPNMLIDSAAGKIAIEYNLHGLNHSVVSACASGTSACGEAFEVIRRGDADAMLVGGSDAALVDTIFAGFDIMGALSRSNEDPQKACRPFDVDRDGFVMSEGSAMLMMESEEHALARGAKIYAEVIGYGSSADAFSMSAPHEKGRGAIDSMKMALGKAADFGIGPENVDYINAHGTATRLNDKGETLAIKRVFEEHAYNLTISSTKSMTGHLLGGAGALETLLCAKIIENGLIPPTINLENPDPDCDLDYTPLKAKEAEVNVTLSNSFGFGGHNATIMLRKYSGE